MQVYDYEMYNDIWYVEDGPTIEEVKQSLFTSMNKKYKNEWLLNKIIKSIINKYYNKNKKTNWSDYHSKVKPFLMRKIKETHEKEKKVSEKKIKQAIFDWVMASLYRPPNVGKKTGLRFYTLKNNFDISVNKILTK